ncbi:LysR family transcriptional regulator [Luteibacter sp. OK325]|uniref:LysR family transcriptional regulator n=1 Tax=Luteibacter sp. OK325 TaxID=2135670 RepID=UPI000D3C8BD3|nr:LysR family transcriptional regulator [Luteibacter sp. OK325]PTR27300.1 LysR family transcriptional regulator [Luteibacter sp. OK325]
MERFTALETFVRIVDAGSFTAAARQLGISQSGASKAMARLEAELGVRLLHRSTRSMSTTDAGRRLHGHAKHALTQLEEALSAVRAEAQQLTGKLRVAAPPGFARQHVVSELPRFLDHNPGLEVEVVMDDALHDVAEARIDLCLRHGEPGRKIPGSRRIGLARRLVVGSPAYFARNNEPHTPDELAKHRVVIWSADKASNTWSFHRGHDVQHVELKGRLRVGSREGMRDALLAQAGIAVVSEWDVASELANGSLRPVLTGWSLPTDEIWAVPTGGRLVSPAVNSMMSFIEASIRRSTPTGSEND